MKKIFLFISLIFLFGCFKSHVLSSVDASCDRETTQDNISTSWFQFIDYEYIGDVDILFVIDNSRTMEEEQQTLVEEAPEMIYNLILQDNILINSLHIGVISTDLGIGPYGGLINSCDEEGDRGELQHTPNPNIEGCSDIGEIPLYLSYSTQTTDLDTIVQQFRCIVALGIDGCGIEQPLEAARKALIDQTLPGGVNEGFLRDNAILVIVFLTDEDDCSIADYSMFDEATSVNLNIICTLQVIENSDYLYPVSYFVDAISSLKEDPRDIIVTLIGGIPLDWNGTEADIYNRIEIDWTNYEQIPVCSTIYGNAMPSARLVSFALSFAETAVIQSICATEWGRVVFHALREKIFSRIRGITGCLQQDISNYSCKVMEILKDTSSCPHPEYQTQLPDYYITDDGLPHTVCEIQRSDWNPLGDPRDLNHNHIHDYGEEVNLAGWYYLPAQFSQRGCPQILFTMNALPQPDSLIKIECE